MDTPKKMQNHMTVIRHALECYANDSLGGMTEKGQEYYREGKAIDGAFDSIQEAIDSLMGGKMISNVAVSIYIWLCSASVIKT